MSWLMDNLLQQRTVDDVELTDADLAVNLDKEAKEEPYESERVIGSAWDHAADVVRNPMGIARTLPWDVFQAPASGGGGRKSLVDELLSAPIVEDSLPRGNAGNNPVGSSAAAAVLSAETDTQAHSAGISSACTSSADATSNAEAHTGKSEDNNDRNDVECLTGKPFYPRTYVDRKLPGVVVRSPLDHHPTNAIVWDKVISGWDLFQYTELARAHPGDDPYFDDKIPEPSEAGSSAANYDPEFYTPVVTTRETRSSQMGAFFWESVWEFCDVSRPKPVTRG